MFLHAHILHAHSPYAPISKAHTYLLSSNRGLLARSSSRMDVERSSATIGPSNCKQGG